MNKKLIITVIIILLIISLVFLPLVKSKSQAKYANEVSVQRGNIISKVVAVGNILPLMSSSVKSPISGTVSELFFDDGDLVKKGDKLLEINPEPTPSNYVQAKQQVKMDLAKEQSAAAEVARYKYLLEQGAISKNDQDYANALKQYHTDHLQRILDEQLLSLLEKGNASIGGRKITNAIFSPADGFIVERNVNLGDSVTPQTEYQTGSVLMVVADMDNLIFKGQVSEADAAKLHQDMKATIEIAALPNVQIEGVLTKLGLQSTQASTSATTSSSSSPFNVGYKLEIGHLVWPKNLKLRAGYSATAEIVVQRAQNVLILPERVLQFEQEKSYVWKSSLNGAPEKQLIKIGLSDGVNVEIVDGLQLGDKVLENGPETLPVSKS